MRDKLRRSVAIAGALAVAGTVIGVSVVTSPMALGEPTYPTTPPAAMCGSSVLDGPTSAPAGAVVVPAGVHNSAFLQGLSSPNTLYYFETGVHYFLNDGTSQNSEYNQISGGQGSTYIGAPGAILDGSGVDNSDLAPDTAETEADDVRYAFGGEATHVTIKNLTVRGFWAPRDEGVVNHDQANFWTLQNNTFIHNQGAAAMAGAGGVITGNCFKENGQYGLNAFQMENQISDLTVSNNEFVGNNTRDWENIIPGGCGCTGGMKFWDVDGADVINNWVHDNRGTGIWADTNNNDFLIEGNLIENNDGTAIFYEISYNAVIKNNNIRNNNWVGGAKFANNQDSFPMGAIYLSETDGEPRLPARTDKIEVTANLFENNWGGVVGWANADRFCNSPASTTADCTEILGWQNWSQCSDPGIQSEPLKTDCRWWTSGLDIHHNTFDFDPAEVAGGCSVQYCGFSALTANYGSVPSWSPYLGNAIQQQMVFSGQNTWHDNTYIGPWRFKAPDASGTMNHILSAYEWTQSPYGQDAGSTFDGGAPTPPTSTTTPPPSTTTPGGQPQIIATNNFEVGPYTPWFGSKIEGKRGGANGGNWSLLITALDAWGAVELNNWPGYSGIVAGETYDFSLYYKEAAPSMDVEWNITWRAGDTDLRTDEILLPKGAIDWTQVSGSLVAPPGATHVTWNYSWADENAGAAVQIDDVVVESN